MSTPPPISPPPTSRAVMTLADFAVRAAARSVEAARQISELHTAGAPALMALLDDVADTFTAVAKDPRVNGIAMRPSDLGAAVTSTSTIGRILVAPITLQQDLSVALAAAAAAPLPSAEVATYLLQSAMQAARALAGLRVALSLAEADQLGLLGVDVVSGPAAVGAVGTPTAFAPVVAP